MVKMERELCEGGLGLVKNGEGADGSPEKTMKVVSGLQKVMNVREVRVSFSLL